MGRIGVRLIGGAPPHDAAPATALPMLEKFGDPLKINPADPFILGIIQPPCIPSGDEGIIQLKFARDHPAPHFEPFMSSMFSESCRNQAFKTISGLVQQLIPEMRSALRVSLEAQEQDLRDEIQRGSPIPLYPKTRNPVFGMISPS